MEAPVITSEYPPIITKLSGKIYAVATSTWIEIDETVTLEDLRKNWIKRTWPKTGSNFMDRGGFPLSKFKK